MKSMRSALLTGCLLLWTISTATAQSLEPALQLTPDERAVLSARLGDVDRPRLSVAMSGGGIRSSLFNLGVLKALYDQGLLQEADLLSSVSGGSYTLYWLYRNQLEDPGLPFGARALADENFPRRMCEIITAGNFVTYWDMAWAAKGGFPGLRKMYLRELVETYGGQDSIADPYSLQDVLPHVRSGEVPYPIINASINSGVYKKQPWASRLFEFTPLHYGNRGLGFMPWNDRVQPIQTAAITSGAALGPLDRKFFQPFPSSGPNNYVELGDGGRTENLGAIAPILRGSDRVIVVDAQLDPRDEPYQAYTRLKSHLGELGLTLAVGGIERQDAPSYSAFKGEVSGGSKPTELVYLKMNVPQSLRLAFASPSAATSTEGNAFEQSYYQALKDGAENGRWDCGSVVGLPGSFRSWLFQSTSNYLAWSEGRGTVRTLTRALPDQQEFPKHTTMDQSFYLDQAVAYIGLGYLVASTGEGARLLSGFAEKAGEGVTDAVSLADQGTPGE